MVHTDASPAGVALQKGAVMGTAAITESSASTEDLVLEFQRMPSDARRIAEHIPKADHELFLSKDARYMKRVRDNNGATMGVVRMACRCLELKKLLGR